MLLIYKLCNSNSSERERKKEQWKRGRWLKSKPAFFELGPNLEYVGPNPEGLPGNGTGSKGVAKIILPELTFPTT